MMSFLGYVILGGVNLLGTLALQFYNNHSED